MTTKTQSPVRFFIEHAGFSYDPKAETPAQGRYRCARRLAQAERVASDRGFSFEWSVDDINSSEWSDDPEPWQQWRCVCRDADGTVLEVLCGIDFGRDGNPWSDPYRRVVEAELSLEAIA